MSPHSPDINPFLEILICFLSGSFKKLYAFPNLTFFKLLKESNLLTWKDNSVLLTLNYPC